MIAVAQCGSLGCIIMIRARKLARYLSERSESQVQREIWMAQGDSRRASVCRSVDAPLERRIAGLFSFAG